MIDYTEILKVMRANKFDVFVDQIENELEAKLYKEYFDEFLDWQIIYGEFPDISTTSVILDNANIEIEGECRFDLKPLLKKYKPWRKGPFNIFGNFIETEWRSDWKWERVFPHIANLKNRTVLDIGCGSGYHSLRAKGAGAKFVIGVEPYFRYVAQFYLLQKYIKNPYVAVLPFKCEDLPTNIKCFDTVFSMGILYHRTAPIDHLLQVKSFLRKGGELILETLIIDDGRDFLMPTDRYAKMPNVWFIPSIKMLKFWLKRSGFYNIRCVDINSTSLLEQKSSEWMRLESLKDFLNPHDLTQTVEGYPAPKRAVIVANK
ncbi:MAG: tRNA 5-methoxyuridine(34)/uridine 5-oxyacetic acid(34) synthase CmoB [bacterium]|nr:tRNA 5-methoxyuridine(34)/uridine 5-oxyacetic acid(34) synthase CmoB [bacterium]